MARVRGVTLPLVRQRIGACWTAGGGVSFDIDLPIPGDGRCAACAASPTDIASAAQAAAEAGAAWAEQPASARAELLRRLAASVRCVLPDLASLQTTEAATPAGQAGISVAHCADYLDGIADLAPALAERRISEHALLRHVPLGAVAIVTSWNQGFANVVQAAANALLAGCTVVLKPSERAPFTATRFVALAVEAGFPDGVVNLVHGGADEARLLVEESAIAGLHLTGGAAAAEALTAIAARRGIPANTELGGKSALIVQADADLVAAAAHAAAGAVVLSGQACAAPTRLLVDQRVRPSFERLLRGFLRRVVPGDPRAPATTMGPMISVAARTRVLAAVDEALSAGAGLLDAAMAPDRHPPEPWLGPIVLTDPPRGCAAARHELFGPVLCLWSFHDEDEAVAAANATPFGLTAYVHGANPVASNRLARRLTAGTVWINGVPPIPPDIPFGGIGASGDGRLGGEAGILRFTRTHTIWRGS